MSLIFKPEKHEYISNDGENIPWLSVTSLVNKFKKPFDAPVQALKSSKNRKSKWFGLDPVEIMQIWSNESLRATSLGSWYHNQRESDLCELSTISREGLEIPIVKPTEIAGIKYAPVQKLAEGVYPEHLVYLKSAALCGQSDITTVINGRVDIEDYKTNKEIKTVAYKSWDGMIQKMSAPISHLDDCHINHYALQLSFYMYMVLKHNPSLKPGNLIIYHIRFEEAGLDQYGNPITARNAQGDPIVKEVIPYNLPYLRSEVISCLSWLKDNPVHT